MSAGPRPERRKSPRIAVHEEHCRLHVSAKVRLLDLSATGALMAAEIPLPLGATGELRFALAGSAFAPNFRICRRASAADRRLLFGGMFTSLENHSRRQLEEFLKRAAP